jgi:hypothetical protein
MDTMDYASPFLFIAPLRLWSIDKRLASALIYGNHTLAQERVDEEGCGAVFGALGEWLYFHTIKIHDEVQVISDHEIRT